MRILFLHLPKCGGTTLAELFRDHYGDGELYEIYPPRQEEAREELSRLPEADKSRIQAVIGHFLFGVHREFEGESKYVTILREPVPRVISMYHHAATREGHQLYEEITSRGLSLEDVLHEGTMPMLDNCQARMLSGYGLDVPYGECGDDMLEKALENLEDHFALVATLRRFDTLLLLMAQRLGWGGLPLYRRRNTSTDRPGPEEVSRPVLELIREHNRLDAELIRYVEERLDEDLLEEGAWFGLKARLFEGLNQAYGAVAPRWRRE